MFCPSCKQDKPESQWYRCRSSPTGFQYYCKSCQLRDKLIWRTEHPEINRKRALDYYRANKEKVLKKKLQQYWSDPDAHRINTKEVRHRNPEKYRAIARRAMLKTYERDPSYFSRKTRKRDAAKKNAVPVWSNKEYVDNMYMLAKLVTDFTGVKYHVDHIVPLTSDLVCGLHNEFNLQVIPGNENSSKGNYAWPNMP